MRERKGAKAPDPAEQAGITHMECIAKIEDHEIPVAYIPLQERISLQPNTRRSARRIRAVSVSAPNPGTVDQRGS